MEYDDEVLNSPLSAADVAGSDRLPPCAEVRRGSVQPCANWVRVRRW